ncbi:hypothetical protein TWF281_002997 [Arthrobotrys megalospora]
MKFTSAVLSFLTFSIVPTLAYGDREICRAKTFYKTKYMYKTLTKVSTQRTTIRMTVTKTVTVTSDSGDGPVVTEEPTAITDPPPKPASTCPPSSIVTDVLRSCIQKPACSKCTKTITSTQTFDCDCIGQKDGQTVYDFKMKCPGDCSCTTFTRYLPADGCTAKSVFVTAVE